MKQLNIRSLYPACILVLIAIPLFLFLGKKPIQLWDEGRNSLNALDMYWYGLSPITYYDNLPDMWNTKPPFLIWLQVISMEIFGVNEFGLRFPSAFAALLTCFSLFIFLKKYLDNKLIGVIAMFVLVSSSGYVNVHGTRTGDYDSLLTFLLTINALLLYSFIETKRNLYIYLFFITLALGVLTKSVAGLFFTPAYALFILLDRKLLFFLKNKHFYFGFLIFLVLVFGFYIGREALNPGYIQAVIDNELGGRFNALTDGQQEKPKHYYLLNLLYDADRYESNRYVPWVIFLIIGFIVGFRNQNKKIRKLTLFLFLILIVHFGVLTFSKTKYSWYDTPWYPMMAIVVSIALFQIYKWIKNFGRNKSISRFSSVSFLVLMLGIPYFFIVKKISFDKSPEYDRNINLLSLYFKDVLNGEKDIENEIVICTENHQYNALFYIEQLRAQGKKIEFVDWENLENGQTLIMGHDNRLKSLIETHYDYIVLENYQDDWEYWGLKKYKIIDKIKEIE